MRYMQNFNKKSCKIEKEMQQMKEILKTQIKITIRISVTDCTQTQSMSQ